MDCWGPSEHPWTIARASSVPCQCFRSPTWCLGRAQGQCAISDCSIMQCRRRDSNTYAYVVKQTLDLADSNLARFCQVALSHMPITRRNVIPYSTVVPCAHPGPGLDPASCTSLFKRVAPWANHKLSMHLMTVCALADRDLRMLQLSY